jgi:adenosine/AMP kinase
MLTLPLPPTSISTRISSSFRNSHRTTWDLTSADRWKQPGHAGVIDGSLPVGIETEAEAAERHQLLGDTGYKP